MTEFIHAERFWGLVALTFAGVSFGGCGSAQVRAGEEGSGGVTSRESSGQGGGASGSWGGGGGGGGSTFVLSLNPNQTASPEVLDAGTATQPPTPDANCGAQTTTTSRVPVDVLLVYDCSISMAAIWDSFRAAVKQAISSTKDVRWGLKLYPSPGLLPICGVNDGVEVALSTNSTAAVDDQLSKITPAGLTPTGRAVQVATTYLKSVVDQSKKAILLATDGEPNCDSDVPTTVKTIGAARDAGFPVYVVGIGASVGNLDNFAQAGGTGKYYPAPSAQDLANALEAISQVVASCTFALTSTPPDIDNIAVYLDKRLVPKDGPDGWSLDATKQSVTLEGSSCEKVKSGVSSTVQVLFGCPGYVAPPVIL